MPIPQVRSVVSSDLARPSLPEDPEHCAVALQAEIGPPGTEGGDVFSFMAVTPKWLASHAYAEWGRGKLIVPAFSWQAIDDALSKLVLRADRHSWELSARELDKELLWEFDAYSPPS